MLSMLRNSKVLTLAALLFSGAALAQGVPTGSGSGGITPGTTGAVCATAGSILYSDGTLVQCAGAVKATSLALGAAGTLQADAANILALRNGTSAQTFNIYNTYTDASNYESGFMSWSGNILNIGADALGTGTRRVTALRGASFNFSVGGTPTIIWQMTSSGHLITGTDNTYDIGASGATRPRNVYIGTGISVGGATIGTNALAVTGTSMFANGTTTNPSIVSAGSSTSGLSFTGSGFDITYSRAGSAMATLGFQKISLSSTGSFGWTSSSDTTAAQDLSLTRAAAATIQHGAADVASGAVAQTITAQGNTGAATTGPAFSIKGAGGGSGASVGGSLDLYGGITSAAAGTGGAIRFYTAPAAAGNAPALALTIASTGTATFAASGGVALSIAAGSAPMLSGGIASFDFGNSTGNTGSVYVNTNNTRRLSVANSGDVTIMTSGASLLWTTDNTGDIGASGATRPRRIYVGTGVTVPGGAAFITTSTALTDGAGASAGTLGNAPSVGNPTKWIGINDNGVTRYIPAW